MKLIHFLALTTMSALVFFQLPPLCADSNVSMNVVAKNTTDEPQEKVVIRQDLPREIKKEDIIDAGGMTVKYDEEKGSYYLYTEENLQPQSTKAYTVVLRDVWRIQDNDFNFLKEQTDQRIESLKDKETYAAGEIFSNKIISQIEDVRAAQQAQTGDIEKRMDFFR